MWYKCTSYFDESDEQEVIKALDAGLSIQHPTMNMSVFKKDGKYCVEKDGDYEYIFESRDEADLLLSWVRGYLSTC
jgi:hypothetical protein